MDIRKFQQEAERIRTKSQAKVQYPSFRLHSESGDVAMILYAAIDLNKGRLGPLHIEAMRLHLAEAMIAIAMLANDLNIDLEQEIQNSIKYKENNNDKELLPKGQDICSLSK